MKYVVAPLFLFALLSFTQPTSDFTATWVGDSVARLTWTQPVGIRETCLYRAPAHATGILVQCWPSLPAGATVVHLGASAGLDGAFRPVAGDSVVLTQDRAARRAQLRGVVYLGVVRGSSPNSRTPARRWPAWPDRRAIGRADSAMRDGRVDRPPGHPARRRPGRTPRRPGRYPCLRSRD